MFTLCSLMAEQRNLFPEPPATVPDDEVAAVLRGAIAAAGRLPRAADMLLCGLCAEYLVEELRGAGFDVVRRTGQG